MNSNVLGPSRDGYGVIHLPRPVLAGARLSVLRGVHCGKFGAIGLRVVFRATGNRRKLRRTLSRLYGRTTRDISSNCGCVVLDSHNISRARTTVPSLLTIDTMRRCLVSTNGHIRATLVMRDNRVHRMVRTTLLLNCNTSTLYPCLACTVLSSLMGGKGVRRSCRATRRGCVGTIGGNLFGVVTGVNVSAVQDCHNTGVFRDVNLDRDLLGDCFKARIDAVNNVKLRAVTHSTVHLRSGTFRAGGLSFLPDVKRFRCHGSNVGRT